MKKLLVIILIVHAYVSSGQIELSEMQSSNSNTIADDMGEFDDWIEIHNTSNDSVEIGGLILKDQLDTWSIPTGDPLTLIPPNGYFLLWADDEEFQGIFHTNFKLASGGEFLGLYESDGITVIDSLTIPSLITDNSYARCGNGWVETSVPTPLLTNNCTVEIDENNLFNDININVHNGELSIEITNDAYEQQHLCIYSIDGKKILESPLNDKQTIINIQELVSGIYIISVSTDNLVYSKKIWF